MPTSVPLVFTSRWAHRLARHVSDGGLDEDMAYWATVPATAAADLPVDRGGRNTVGYGLERPRIFAGAEDRPAIEIKG